MSSLNRINKATLLSALAAASGLAMLAPAHAQEAPRSFYQNAGGNCHGINSVNDAKLRRVAGRLQNNTTSSVDVVCNLMTDALSVDDGISGGVVTGVYLWARRNSIRGDNGSISCTLTTGYAGGAGQTVTQPIVLPGTGNGQGVVSFTPTPGTRFAAPANIRCILPPLSELNDSLVTYTVLNAVV